MICFRYMFALANITCVFLSEAQIWVLHLQHNKLKSTNIIIVWRVLCSKSKNFTEPRMPADISVRQPPPLKIFGFNHFLSCFRKKQFFMFANKEIK